MTTSRASIVNIHCPPSSSVHGWQVESGYYSDSYNNSTSSMSNNSKQHHSHTGVHPRSTCCPPLIPPTSSSNLFHRSSCHKRQHQTASKDIISCSCAHHPYLQHKINGNHSSTNATLLCSIDHSTNMKSISEHHLESSNDSCTDSHTSPSSMSQDDESGNHSAMDSNALSPLLTPPPVPPMIPLDHGTLLSQIKTATRNSILLTTTTNNDTTSMSTNHYKMDSGFDSSTSHGQSNGVPPPPPPPPIPPPISSSMIPSNACTAFMIQTQTGNALLIPHTQGTLMSSAAIDSNGNPIHNGTLPLRSSAYSCPNSTQVTTTTMSTMDRPNSNSSNVYQTIDADSHREYVIHPNDNKNEIFPDTPLLPCFRNNCYVYPLDHHHHHSHSHMRCNCDSTTTYNEQTTTTTRQSTHSPCPLFNNSNNRLKKRQNHEKSFKRYLFSWKSLAIIFLLTTLCFLTSTIYLSMLRFYHPTVREINQTNAKNRYENIFYGKTTRFIRLGDQIKESIDAQSSTQLQFYIERSISVQFNFTAQRRGNFGIYGKRSNSPSLTQFDFFHPFHGQTNSHSISRRSLAQNRSSQVYFTHSTDDEMTLLFHELLTTGLWYLTIINDGTTKEKFRFNIEQLDEKHERLCLNNCNNRGICQQGVCLCQPSYTGVDCSIAQCTDLCSGHGVVEHGQCRCQEGWHGAECQLMSHQCEVPNCNQRGSCVSGQCICQTGYQGKFCEQISCRDVNCSGHGLCVEGKCRCFHGYTADDCSVLIQSQCDHRCSGHGQYVDYPQSMCICEKDWTGTDCSQRRCSLDCGVHGKCSNDSQPLCQCEDGWTGETCSKRVCPKHCQQCNDDGHCICPHGYTGRFCQINACPNNCNGHGECKQNKCICQNNWFGSECQFTVETNCQDRLDNDNDGLVDCLDPDCCSSPKCQSTDECLSRTSAKDILLRRQAPSPSASFFERMQFLIQEDGLQTSSIYSSFNERRAAVIRGQIFYKKQLPLQGVRVQVFNQPNQGYTVTDKDGVFNLLINGGGSVLIQFVRQPFQTKQSAFIVPWNSFLHVGFIYMDEKDEINACKQNLTDIIEPKLWDTSLDRNFLSADYDDYALTLGSQIVRKSISIDKNDLPIKFVYLSSSSNRRYQSVLTVVLTGNQIDNALVQVHLSISIEGIYFSKQFQADRNLVYEYEWSRRNAYDQNVHGLAEAIVSIGYEYFDCQRIIWYQKSVKITGQDIPTANVGGWTFSVHHKLNIPSGILHKGDGTNMLLSESPLRYSTLIGIRDQSRSIDCRKCEENSGVATKLFHPMSLTVSNDGTIYIGDLNIIWMYQTSTGMMKPVLELNEQYIYKYYLTTDPIDGRLYIGDNQRRQILRLIRTDSIENLRENFEIVVGNGHYCSEDLSINVNCGDGSLARDVSLSYPKGLTIDRVGNMYFIDGQRIRQLSIGTSRVSHLVGSFDDQLDYQKQLSCDRFYRLENFKFYNPTTLQIHPLDGDLYVLDDSFIYRIRKEFHLIELILGQPSNCFDKEKFVRLNNPIDFSFNHQGDLILLERTKPFVRILRSANNQIENAKIFFDNEMKMKFSSINSYLDGSILIGNLATKEILKLNNDDEQSNGFNIHSADKNEIYVFNRVGQHRSTIDALTGETIFNFTYDSPQNAYGKLESINYRNGQSLVLKYDYAMRINDIVQMPSGNKFKIDFSKQKFLSNFVDANGRSSQFVYDNGLLTSISENNVIRTYFIYDKFGHIQRIVHQDGFYKSLTISANHSFYRVDLRNPTSNETYLINKSALIHLKNNRKRFVRRELSDSTSITTQTNPSIQLISTSNRSPISTNRPIVLNQTIDFNSTFQLSNTLIYSVLPNDHEQLRTWNFKINDQLIFTMSFDHFERKLFVQDQKSNEIFTMFYTDKYRLASINARGFLPISYSYRENDQKLFSWKIGSYYEEFLYDRRGRLIEIQRFNDLASIKYSYGHGEQPVGITYGSQTNVMLRKDSTGSITGVIMPNQAEHTLEYRTYFNGYRLIYSGLFNQIWEYDSKSNLRRIYFPHQRLITLNYDENNRLISQFADGCRRTFINENDVKQIRTEFARGQIHHQIFRYHSNGLLNQFIDHYENQQTNGYFLVFIQYHHIHSFELRLISSKNLQMNSLENYPTVFRSNYSSNYESPTSFLLQSNSFVRLTYPTIFECFIKDYSNSITFSRRIDEMKRLKEINFNSKNQKRLSIEFVYNNKQLLLEQMKISLNDLDKFVYSYQYDQFKRLISIRKNDQLIDSYQYDLNNNLNFTMQYKSIEYNQWNQLVRLITNDNQTSIYQYDQNGFLHWISQEKLFIFNSFGLLIKYKTNEIQIDFVYDSEQRLILKSYPLTGVYLQFIYGNLIDRRSITHIYHSQLKSLTTIFYDDRQFFIGFEQNQRKYFVLTDSIGSPLFIYDQQGLLIQENFFSLFGSKLIEKNYQEKIFFPFGHAGRLIDDDLNCAFDKINGRISHLVLGRYFVPTFPSNWFEKRTFRPKIDDPLQQMNLYQIDRSIYDVNEIFFNNLHRNEILDQFKDLKYDFANQFESILTSPFYHYERTIFDENSFVYSSFFSSFAEHYSVSYPNRFVYSIAHLHHENDFWLNRTLLINSLNCQIEYFSMNSHLDDPMSILFNRSSLIPFRKQNHLFFLQNLEDFQSIKSQLNENLFRQIKTNIRYSTMEIEFSIRNSTIIHIQFGSTFDQEYQRLIEENLSQMNSIVWQRERSFLMENARSFHLHTWSQNEIDELISNGHLTNYTLTYRYDPRLYPEIIDDPSNVKFQLQL